MKCLLLAATGACALAGVAFAMSDRPDKPGDEVWQPAEYSTIKHPEWAKDAVLYQINTRQFTPEGTFAAAEKQLPRLKELGVDVLWLMPIHPIGAENRKGTLGSPYSVRNYYEVNPEFGTKADFKRFVDTAHRQGFKVILDWVANHTAWDNKLAKDHPDWYEKDWQGNFRPTPWWDWSDVIDLDWSKPGVRQHVGEAMEMWVRDYDVDGFRADVAGYVPLDFWEKERARLDTIKPVFMLAEWKSSELTRSAFDAVYAWEWHTTVKNIAKGEADATGLYGYYAENESAWPRQAMRLTYIENHDSNAWEGTQYENFGPALPAFVALSFTGEGLAMVHNGQEACNAKRLEFFEKDTIDWSKRESCDIGALIKDLIAFRRANRALANGEWGARMSQVLTDKPKEIFAWVREKDGNRVVGLFNLSDRSVAFQFADNHAAGTYRVFRNSSTVESLRAGDTISLPAWGYQILTSN